MKLVQIKLSGFKSFATTTRIELKENIIAIVGPNGCGKSNIIDAIRWVLGVSNASKLRGGTMEDVIFNGALNKSRYSRASVELVFTNSRNANDLKTIEDSKSIDNSQASHESKSSSLWHNYDEIAIKRVISRDGSSGYTINNQPVRRKDVIDLFLGTGLGSNGYAIIEQGMIGKIIESKQEELKLLLDEVAGLSKYKLRREQALSKIDDNQHNLLRLHDIKDTLGRQINGLYKQAVIAMNSQTLDVLLKSRQCQLLQVTINQAAQSLLATQKEQQELESVQLANQQVIDHHEQRIEALKNNVLLTQEKQLASLYTAFNHLRTDVARQEERLENLVTQKNIFLSTRDKLLKKLANINEEQKNLQHNQSATSEEVLNNYKQELAQLELAYEQQLATINSLALPHAKEGLSNLKNLLQTKSGQLQLLNNNKEHKQNDLKRLQKDTDNLIQEQNAIDLNGLNAQIIRLKTASDEADLGINHLQQERQQLVAKRIKHDEIVEGVRKKRQEVTNALIAYDKQLTFLKDLINRQTLEIHSQTRNSAGKNTDHANKSKGISDICDVNWQFVWQGIKVSPGYEKSVTTVLANILHACYHDDCDDLFTLTKLFTLGELLEQFKQTGSMLWFRFNAPSKQVKSTNSNDMYGCSNLASQVTIVDNRLNDLLQYLAGYLVCDDLCAYLLTLSTSNGLNDLKKLANGLVDKNGHLLTQDYLQFYQVNKKGGAILEYSNQFDELTRNHAAALAQHQNLSDELNLLNQQSTLYMQAATALDNDIASKQKNANEHKITLIRSEEAYNQLMVRHASLQNRIMAIHNEGNLLAGQLAELEADIATTHNTHKQLQQDFLSAQLKYEELEVQFVSANTQLTTLKEAKLKVANDHALALIRIQQTNAALQQQLRQQSETQEELTNIDNQLANHDNLLPSQQANLARLQGELNITQTQINQLEKAICATKNDLQAAHDELTNTHAAKEQIAVKIHGLLLDVNKHSIHIEDYTSQLNHKKQELLILKQPEITESAANKVVMNELIANGVITQDVYQDTEIFNKTAINLIRKISDSLEVLGATIMPASNNVEACSPNDDATSCDAVDNIIIHNPQELKASINDIIHTMKNLGAINHAAIAELATLATKYNELSQQVMDLNEASDHLRQSIAMIDDESRLLLQDAYGKLNENFNHFFKRLFGGGEASLALTGSDDILHAGMKILAKPPGKQTTLLTLLSGGEKALSALSLVFALFHLKPAPFCVLDEVDAPLDDANTLHFCELVQELANNTQFIYVSHNQLALNIAKQLIGVTQQEKGLSIIATVTMEEAVSSLII